VEKEVYLGLDGRAALVTVAGSGAGKAIAFWLARAGCDVAVVDPSGDAAEGVAEELRELDFTAIAVAADLRTERDADAMVRDVVAQFDSLDVAVNCLSRPPERGRGGAPEHGRALDAELAVMTACCRTEARAMAEPNGGGALVNVVWGRDAERSDGSEGDDGTLASAVERLTQTLAVELAPAGVRVNAIHAILGAAPEAGKAPAARADRTRTAGVRARAVPAEDLGRVAVFLASDLSRGVTGQVLRVVSPDGPPTRAGRRRQRG
jgi:3-oxoacyl-[acyl-carrier protein] reductase